MRFGNYSVQVVEGFERGESGYCHVPHGKAYTLRLGNHGSAKCQADVVIDGKPVGSFVLRGYQTATIERGVDDTGRFTFYADGTSEAVQAGIAAVANVDRGLVQVVFSPEKSRPVSWNSEISVLRTANLSRRGPGGQSQGGWGNTRSTESYCGEREEKTGGGITGLSGYSTQQFREAAAFDVDESKRVTVTLRLVRLDEGPRPLVGVSNGNSVPPPVN